MIYGVTLIKDEEDIVESMVRYNMQILDKMIIIDNGSSDYTWIILNKLKDEGFNLILERDCSNGFNQVGMTNSIIYKIKREEYGQVPDFVIPLDADEFIVAESNNCSPLNIVSTLDKEHIHKVKWRSYIPSIIEFRQEFVPLNYEECRTYDNEVGEKMIIPMDLVCDNFCVNYGNHFSNLANCGKEVINTKLRIAHYPIRTIDQFYKKTILGYMNRMSTPVYEKGRSIHIENAYFDILNEKRIDIDYLRDRAINYCTGAQIVTLDEIEEKHFDIRWCGCVEMKYTYLLGRKIERTLLDAFEGMSKRLREKCLADISSFESPDLEAMNAIEQYSFRKMKIERRKNDHYTRQLEIINEAINLESNLELFVDDFLSNISGVVLIKGYNSLTKMIAKKLEKVGRFAGWCEDEFDNCNDGEILKIDDIISNEGIDKILLFDDVDSEEFSALNIQLKDRVIKFYDVMKEMRKNRNEV